MSKKFLVAASVTSALLGVHSAMATDYAACREMLRAKDQLIYANLSSAANRSLYRSIRQYNEEIVAKTACEKKYFASNSYPSAEESALIAQCISKSREQRKQHWDSIKLEQEQISQTNQQKLDKALAKIKRDMRKADCPYE